MQPTDLFHRDDLNTLASNNAAPLVTLMMPTAHVEADLAQNPIRLKNLLRQVHDELQEQGFRDQEIDTILKRARGLLDDERFWRQLSDGLIMFLGRDEAHFYRLPLELDELVITGSRFHLVPLFPLVSGNSRFYLLALSQNRVEFYQGTRFSMNEIHTSEIPRSLLDALALDDPEKSLQLHTGAKMNKGRQDAVFHGHGTQNEDSRSRPHDALKRFFQQIDDGIRHVLGDDDAPMVLAGVKYYLPIYREVNSYRKLIDDEIVSGNPERTTPKELHARTWEIIARRLRTAENDAIERFRIQYSNHGGLASTDIREIIAASVYKRVDTLFVPGGRHQWGRYDPADNTLELHEDRQPGDDDMYDVAAANVFLNGGQVHILTEDEMPSNNGNLAAIFRYAPGAPAREQTVRRAVPLAR